MSALAATLLLAPASARAGWDQRVVAGMDTHVYTPDSLSPVGDGRGLLIVLHGCVQTAAQLQAAANLEPGADEFGVAVAIPQVPAGGVFAGCWDYYGANHTRVNRHNDDLLALAEELSNDPALAIDPDQVYLSGFSSGGGQAIATGCLAPEVFAGVGIAAGPALGTEAVEIGFVSTTSAAAAALCETLAGPASGEFATQLTAIHTGTSDFTVAQDYALINAEAFALRYGPGLTTETLDVGALEGHAPAGEGTLWLDDDGPRIAWMKVTGATHAWPAGSGPGALTGFVEGTGVNFGWYLAEFFTVHNRRVETMPAEPETTGGDPGETTGDDSGDTMDPETTTGETTGDDSGASTGAPAPDDTGSDAGSSGEPGISGGVGISGGLEGTDGDCEEHEGCACAHGPSRGGGGALALTLGLLGLTMSRRRRGR